MKRPVLITTGALGGLGAVLAVTPPQFTQNASVDLGAGTTAPIQSSEPVASTTPTSSASTSTPATKNSKPASVASSKVTPSKTSQPQATSNSNVQSQSPTPTQTPTSTSTPTPSKTEAPQTSSGNSGTFNGGTYDANRYGRVSVTITVKNGQITQSNGSQSPSSWSQNVIPTLDNWIPQGKITISQIMSYSASELPCSIANSCRSRASYTANAYWSSVQSALKKAGY